MRPLHWCNYTKAMAFKKWHQRPFQQYTHIPLHPLFLYQISTWLWLHLASCQDIMQIFSTTAPLLVIFLIEGSISCSFQIGFVTQRNKRGHARPWVGRVNRQVLMSTHLMTSRWHPRWALIGDIQINNHRGSQRCVNCIRKDWEALSSVQHPLETNSHFHLYRVN